MIDFIYSKLALIVAALIIASTLIGAFAWQRRETEEVSLQSISENISRLVNEVSSGDNEVKRLVTFDEEKRAEATYFPARVGGETYDMRISINNIILDQDDKSVSSSFSYPVHVWNPGDMENVTNYELERANDKVFLQEFTSGTDLYVESTFLKGSGYETFIYPAESEEFQEEHVDTVGNKINDFFEVEQDDIYDGIDKVDSQTTDRAFTAHPGVIVFEENGRDYESLYVVDVDHVWDPDEHINGDTVTKEELEEIDNEISSIEIEDEFELRQIDVEIEGEYKTTVRNFLYK